MYLYTYIERDRETWIHVCISILMGDSRQGGLMVATSPPWMYTAFVQQRGVCILPCQEALAPKEPQGTSTGPKKVPKKRPKGARK